MTPNVARLRRRISLALGTLTLLLVGSLFLRYGVATVPTGYTCLLPEISPGDRVLYDRDAPRSGTLQAGQLVLFDATIDSSRVRRLGRVLAVPGTRISTDRGELSIGDLPRDEPPPADPFRAATLPEESYLILTHDAIADGPRDTRRTVVVRRADIVARVLLPLGW